MDEPSLDDAHIRSIVQLLAQVAIVEGSLNDKKSVLLNGLSRLIGADCWVWTALAPTEPGEKPVAVNFLHGGFSAERFAAYSEAIEHPNMALLNAPFLKLLEERRAHTTKLRQQLDPENSFVKLPVYPLWQNADIAPLLLSCYPFETGSMSLIALYRQEKSDLFSPVEARIAHILLSEVRWLHEDSLPNCNNESSHSYLNLSPRQRTTLNLLLEGLGRKQIAAYLSISENTVSGYVKEIYRFYGVRSHAELLRHFRHGDRGDL